LVFGWLGTGSAPWHPGPCRPDSGHRPAALLRPPEHLGREAVFCPESPFRQGKSPVSGCFRVILVSWLPCTSGFAAGPMRPCAYRSPALCGPSVAVLTADLPCQARWDALDGLTVAATLAHEL